MNKLFILFLMMIVLSSSAYALTETHGFIGSSNAPAQTVIAGHLVNFSQAIILTNITKHTSGDCDRGQIYNLTDTGSASFVASTTILVGDILVFSPPVELFSASKAQYLIGCDKVVPTYSRREWTGSPGYPVSGTFINWSKGSVDFAGTPGFGTVEGYNIVNISFILVEEVLETATPTYQPPTPADNAINTTNQTINCSTTSQSVDLRYYLNVSFGGGFTDSPYIFNATPDGVNQSEGLVLYYPFNINNTLDYSYFGNNGTRSGATWNATGGVNDTGGFEFDGVDDFIDLPTDIATFGTNDFTLLLWAKRDGGNNGQAKFAFAKTNSDSDRLFIANDAGDFAVDLTVGTATGGCKRTFGTLGIGSGWQHYVGVGNGTDILLYLNGGFVTSGVCAYDLNDNTLTQIGNLNSGGSNAWNGSIDEVMIFNRSLSASEITELYLQSAYRYDGVSNFKTFETNFSDGTYTYDCFVQNSTNGVFSDSISRNLTIDTTIPTMITNFLNDSFIFNKNLTGQFNFSDNINLHTINVSIDGESIFHITNINSQTYIFNLSYNISTLSLGQHDLTVYWADGHTANEIGDYDVSNGLFNDYLKYEFPDKGNIKTELKSKSILDTWTSEKRKDRYIQILEPSNPSDTITLIEESDMPIHIAYKEGSYNDYWIIMGNHWKDYVLENEPNIVVSINRINEKKVEVTISGIKNKDRLVFNSVGDLNTVTKEYSFYALNMTETFDTLITEGFEFSLDLAVDFGNIEFDISGITPTATLQWNSTNFTSTVVSFDSTGASFRKTFSPITIEKKETIVHNWWFNFSTFTDGYLRTNNASQIASSINVDVCNATFTNYTILNLTYFDEVNSESISITNAYQLTIFDGTFYYNQTGSFVNNFSSTFCTNLNPLEVSYNWDLWGLMTLSKTGYITRVLDIDEAVPIAISNDPQTNLSLFLVGTLNSSTVTYTWQTTGFQPIDGTMRIFKCNPDGSQDLVESTPIISGESTANIQLLLQTYSYDVIIDGTVFKDLESYTRCHVESTTERTFFVDVDPIDIAPLIGLAGIRCNLEESATNNSITMVWTPNPQLEGYVTGCIVADRRTIRGSVNVLDDCSIESEGYVRTLAVPVVDGNNYVVTGRLKQGNNQLFCTDSVILTPGRKQGGLFGVSGLLAVIFLVASLGLIYASDGEFMLAGGAIGLVIAWFLGLLVFDWIVVSGIIFFFALIAVTGRYTRKK